MPQVRTLRTNIAGPAFKQQHQATEEFWRRLEVCNGGRNGDPHDYAEIVDIYYDEGRGWVIEYEVPAELLERSEVCAVAPDPEPNCQNLLEPAKLAEAAPVRSEPVFESIDKEQPVPVKDVLITGWNPRKAFDGEELQALAEDIRQNGLINAVTVRPKGKSKYELVAGERRLRAFRLLGRVTIPAKVRELTDEQVLDIMLAENLQRVDLNPIEEAHHLKRVLEVGKLTQTDLGHRVGKSQEWVSQRLRLAEAPAVLQDLIIRRQINTSSAIEMLQWKNTEHYDAIMHEIGAWVVEGEELPRARVREIIKEITEPVAERLPREATPDISVAPPLNTDAPEASGTPFVNPEDCRDCDIYERESNTCPEGCTCDEECEDCFCERTDDDEQQDLPDESEPTTVAEVGPHEIGKASRDPWAKEVRTFECKVCHQVFIDKKGMETVAMVTHLIGDGYHDAHEDAARKVLAKAHERPIKEDLLRYFGGGSELEDDVRIREHEADLAVKEFDDGSRWQGSAYLEECCRSGDKEAIEARKKRNKLTEARLKIRKEAEAKGVTL